MVYDNAKTGEVMIVEAKGGGSTRGGRKDKNDDLYVEQGTKEYRESIEMSMNRQMDDFILTDEFKNSPEFQSKFEDLSSTMCKIASAGELGGIKSIQVTQKLNKDGSLTETAKLDFFET